MFEEHNPVSKILDNSKAGITVCLNQDEGGEPFEATVYFKKKGKNADELRDEKAVVLTASGKLRLDIGKDAFVEIFAERSDRLADGGTEEQGGFLEEEPGDV